MHMHPTRQIRCLELGSTLDNCPPATPLFRAVQEGALSRFRLFGCTVMQYHSSVTAHRSELKARSSPMIPAPANTSSGRRGGQTPNACGASTRSRPAGQLFKNCARSGRAGRRPPHRATRPGSTRTQYRTKIAELFAGCSKAILDFSSRQTDVDKTAGPAVAAAEEGAGQ